LSVPVHQRTRVIIATPEFVFGTDSNNGISPKLLENPLRLKLIVINEAHLIFDWASFRAPFGQMVKLKSLLASTPIMALSATLKPSSLTSLKEEILREPIVINQN